MKAGEKITTITRSFIGPDLTIFILLEKNLSFPWSPTLFMGFFQFVCGAQSSPHPLPFRLASLGQKEEGLGLIYLSQYSVRLLWFVKKNQFQIKISTSADVGRSIFLN